MLRPKKLENYVGQEHLKIQISRAIQASKYKNEAFGHTLFTGASGCGKTSISAVIASEMGVNFEPVFATSITKPDDIKEILRSKLNQDGYSHDNPEPIIPSAIKPTVLFIDEIHNLSLKVRETLYTVMEDRVYWEEDKNPWNGKKQTRKTWVPKFTLIGATTREGILEKAFLDRFRYIFKIEKYTPKECESFVINALENVKKTVKDLAIEPNAITQIAMRSRGVARTAIHLTERCIDHLIGSNCGFQLTEEITKDAFKTMHIDELGLTPADYKILIYLAKCFRPTGLASLASFLEELPASIESKYEPHLLSSGYMIRTPQGRVISESGFDLLKKKGLIKQETRRVLLDE